MTIEEAARSCAEEVHQHGATVGKREIIARHMSALVAEYANHFADVRRILKWLYSDNPGPAALAFTSGPERQVADLLEAAEARVVEQTRRGAALVAAAGVEIDRLLTLAETACDVRDKAEARATAAEQHVRLLHMIATCPLDQIESTAEYVGKVLDSKLEPGNTAIECRVIDALNSRQSLKACNEQKRAAEQRVQVITKAALPDTLWSICVKHAEGKAAGIYGVLVTHFQAALSAPAPAAPTKDEPQATVKRNPYGFTSHRMYDKAPAIRALSGKSDPSAEHLRACLMELCRIVQGLWAKENPPIELKPENLSVEELQEWCGQYAKLAKEVAESVEAAPAPAAPPQSDEFQALAVEIHDEAAREADKLRAELAAEREAHETTKVELAALRNAVIDYARNSGMRNPEQFPDTLIRLWGAGLVGTFSAKGDSE